MRLYVLEPRRPVAEFAVTSKGLRSDLKSAAAPPQSGLSLRLCLPDTTQNYQSASSIRGTSACWRRKVINVISWVEMFDHLLRNIYIAFFAVLDGLVSALQSMTFNN